MRNKGDELKFECVQNRSNSPLAHNCYVWKENPDIITLYCDMGGRCTVDATGTGGMEPPQIWVSHGNDEDIDDFSIIKLTEFMGWDIFTAHISKDILAVCLIREESNDVEQD